MKEAFFILLLVAPNGCKIDNIDRANPTLIRAESLETCEAAASEMNKPSGVRATCITISEGHQ